MKIAKYLLNLFILTSIISLTACSDDDDKIVNTHDDAYGDVITKKIKIPTGDIRYLPVFFAGAEGIVADGSSVKGPDGTVYDLHEFWAGPGKLTAVGDKTPNMPPAGTYTFTLKFTDGYEKTVTDQLEGADTTVPQIDVTYNQNTNPQTIEISWTDVPEADFYCVKMTDLDMANNKPYFKKPMIDKSEHSFIISLDGSYGWMRPVTELQSGIEYFIVVSAKKVETGTPVSGASKDFEVNGCSKKKITYQQ